MIQTLIVAAAGVRQLPRPLHDTKALNTELKRADIFVVKKYPPSGGYSHEGQKHEILLPLRSKDFRQSAVP